jgi:cellulose 1,4-beta-cellobiosidase
MSRRYLRSRPMMAGIAAAGLLTASAVALTAAPASAAPGCRVDFTANSWDVGFSANFVLTNTGDPVTSWTLTFTLPNGSLTTNNWSANWSQSGTTFTATNMSWNGSLATGANTNFGFNGSKTANSAAPAPTNFRVNGTPCGGQPPTSPPPTSPPPTSPPPTSPPPTSPPPTSPPPTSPPPAGTHVDNPYVGSKFYVNPDWSAKAAAQPGGTRISNQSTGVWLDRIAAIAGSATSMGLQAHLDAAVAQQTGTQPVAIEFVIYDLPGRDCAALASNGELAATDLASYQTRYIDPIAALMSQPKYAGLRIITVIEPDSLPNLVTNVNGIPACATMQQNGNYVKGVQYALNKLHAIPNVYTYVDAAHSGWLGWDSNFGPAIQLFASVVSGTTARFDSIDGFITDTANYTATTEPFLTNPNQQVGGQPVNSANFFQFNPFLDELTFAQAFYTRAVAAGFRSNMGMLIDTSRNGWGGPNRPTAASTNTTNVNTFVDASRVDKRPSRGDWCNQSGAGLGFRPVATPATHIDAYVWIKPPGESDGSSTAIPNDQGKGFDRMCDPTYGGNSLNNNSPSNALPNSPLSGDFFPAQFAQLMANAFPAL